MKKNLFIILLILGVGVLSYFTLLQSFMGYGVLIYENELDIFSENSGVYTTTAKMLLPEKTSNFSFTVDYDNAIEWVKRFGVSSSTAKIKYEVFNYKTNTWTLVHSKSWTPNNKEKYSSSIEFDGEGIYSTGVPDKIVSIRTVDSSTSSASRKWDSYISCLYGSDVNTMKTLYCNANPLATACVDSRYTIKCLYPEQVINEHEVNDDSDNSYDDYYFPDLTSLDSSYVKDNSVYFRITIDKTTGLDTMRETYFRVNLVDVKTELDTYYRLENNLCNEMDLMTFEIGENDYTSSKECKENILVNKYYYNNESCVSVEVKQSELDNNYFSSEQSCLNYIYRLENPSIINDNYTFYYIGVGVILMGVILFFFIKRNSGKPKRK